MHTRLTLAAALLALTAAPLLAEEPDPRSDTPGAGGEGPEPSRISEDEAERIDRGGANRLTIVGRAGIRHQADADFDDGIGELSLTEYEAWLSASWRFESDARLTLTLRDAFLDYDATPSSSAVAGDAASIGSELDTIQQIELMAIYSDRINDTTGWFVGGGVSFSGEEDADFGDSADWLATAGFDFKQSDTLRLGLGVLAKSRLEDDVLVIPVPRIEWDISERWSLRSQRAGLRLRYAHSDELAWGISGQYRSDSFRLDDTHAAAVEGMGTHRRFPVALFATYTPGQRIVIEGSVGAALGGELEFLDANGNDVSKQDIDPGIFGALSVSIRF